MSARQRSLWTLLLVAATLLAACGGAAEPAQPAAAPTPTPSRLSAPALSPGMAHMMAALPDEDVPAATTDQGNQPLAYREENGVKVFELTAQPVRWTFMEGVQQVAWTYNGMVPGPVIRVACASWSGTTCRKTQPSTGTASRFPTRWTACRA